MTGARRLAVGLFAVVITTAVLGLTAWKAAGVSSFTVTRVISAPDGRGQLSSRHMNVVRVHPGLRFAVGLRNDATARKLTVSLTITGGTGSAIVARRAISLASRAGTTVRLDGLDGKISFAQRQLLTIRVIDTRHRASWVRSYPIIFALG